MKTTKARRQLTRSAAVLTAALAVGVPHARGNETAAPPTHLVAYDLAWLDYLDPADQPAHPQAVCIVDSGLAVTPDTPADDSVNGPILARVATDGGPGEPQGSAPEQLHGTRMVATAIAPQNEWGTIGAWTGGRVVSVRAMTDNATTFSGDGYRRGITTCEKVTPGMPMAVVSLSLGCSGCSLSDEERADLDDAVTKAHGNGLSVVAAAGNIGGTAPQVPASLPGVFAVAAGAQDGSLCSYGSFDQSVAVLAPACPAEAADPLTGAPISDLNAGSSTATAVASTLLAALRSLRPDASWQQAETWVRDSARTVDGRRVLDGKAAAIAAGLGDIVARAEKRQAAAQATSPVATSSPTDTSTPTPAAIPDGEPSTSKAPRGRHRLARPKLATARWANHRLVVRVRNRPPGAGLRLVAEQLGDDFHVLRSHRITRAAGRVTLKLRWRPDHLQLSYIGALDDGDTLASTHLILHRTRNRFR